MTPNKVFLIHGAFGSPEENWFPWIKNELEKINIEIIAPKFPTPEGQNLKNWINVFNKYKEKLDQNTLFIGHSLAPAFILSVLEKIDFQIPACFFVAGFTGLLGNETFVKIAAINVPFLLN